MVRRVLFISYGILIGFSGLTICMGTASAFDSVEFEQKVTEFIKAGLACHNNPGLSVSVVKDGSVVLAKGFGHKAMNKAEPVTNTTLFSIASLTKAFAATLILKQIEENSSLSLSTQVRTILGQDDIFKGYLRAHYTTLEDILAHRMGYPSNNNIRLDDKLTRKSLVDRLKHFDPTYGFRTSFSYSNVMYGLATYISEVLGGKSWEELVKEKIFDPLDMTSSTFVTTADPNVLDLATGYQDRYGTLVPVPFEFSRRWGVLCGSGCVLSNAVDMANWMKFHLNNGINDQDKRVLDPDILEEAHKAQNSISYSSTTAKYYTRPLTPVTLSHSNYGLGWRLGHYRGYPLLVHTGSTYGYRAMLSMYPGSDTGIFTVCTGDDPSYLFRTNLHLYMSDLLLGHEPWLDNTTICSFPEPWKKSSANKPKSRPRTDVTADRPLVDYEGTFSNMAYGSVEVYLNNTSGRLMATIGFAEFVLYPKSKSDEFFAQGHGLLENIRDFSTLQFGFKNAKVDTLTVPSMESKDPPKFKRRDDPVRTNRSTTNGACATNGDTNGACATNDDTNSACATNWYIITVCLYATLALFNQVSSNILEMIFLFHRSS